MKASRSFWLILAVLYAGALAIAGSFAVVLGASVPPGERDAAYAMISEALPALAYTAIVALFACAGLARWLTQRYPVAIRKLADQTRTLVAGHTGQKLAASGSPEVRELAGVIDQLRERHMRLESSIEAKSIETRAHVEDERDRFAALVAELSEGVLVCNANGRILLYNASAAGMLRRLDSAAHAASTPLGLARSVFAVLDRDQVAHALDKLQRQRGREDGRAHTRFVTAVGGRLLRVKVTPFLSRDRQVAGMIFTLEDISALVERERRRLELLQTLAADMRIRVAFLRAAADGLAASPDMDTERRARLVGMIADGSRAMSEHIDNALREHSDALAESVTLEDMRIADLLAVMQQRIEGDLGLRTHIDMADEQCWIRVDSFALVHAALFLASRLAADYGVRQLGLRAAVAKRYVELDLIWTGAIVSSEALSMWEHEPMRIAKADTPLSLRDVLARHGGELSSHADRPRQRAWFRFLLPAGEAAASIVPAATSFESRPEYYDFDLFERIEAGVSIADRPLAELTYTVFDTETTGLEPSAGDEIISIGAVRIVNGRMLKNDVFEQLVNPRRPIARESTRIHGLDSAALADQPTIVDVLPRFHRFCEETVLVAHNAAFDMRFLELKEAATGVRFDHPVLDTLLLSAIAHPSFENHDLDVIAERLGVRVIGRHTAVGDALVTAEVFLELLPLLAARNVVTLGQALEASRSTFHARLRY
jgi:DNA polymerase-3 subunit epsilon